MKNLFTLLMLSALILTSACNDDELLQVATVFANDEMAIRVSESRNDIYIQIDALTDTLDNRTDDNYEYATIAFDINNNRTIDNTVDFGYSSIAPEYDICPFYFRDANALSPCGELESSATFTVDFRATDILDTPHIVWEFRVSKEELEDNETLDFAVKTFSNNTFGTYPKDNITSPLIFSFDSLFTFEW